MDMFLGSSQSGPDTVRPLLKPAGYWSESARLRPPQVHQASVRITRKGTHYPLRNRADPWHMDTLGQPARHTPEGAVSRRVALRRRQAHPQANTGNRTVQPSSPPASSASAARSSSTTEPAGQKHLPTSPDPPDRIPATLARPHPLPCPWPVVGTPCCLLDHQRRGCGTTADQRVCALAEDLHPGLFDKVFHKPPPS